MHGLVYCLFYGLLENLKLKAIGTRVGGAGCSIIIEMVFFIWWLYLPCQLLIIGKFMVKLYDNRDSSRLTAHRRKGLFTSSKVAVFHVNSKGAILFHYESTPQNPMCQHIQTNQKQVVCNRFQASCLQQIQNCTVCHHASGYMANSTISCQKR